MSEFPTDDMEITTMLVVSDVARAKSFYLDVLGATLYREYGGTSVVMQLLGHWLLVVSGGEPTKDKPTVTLDAPADPDRVSTEMIFRVPDCRGAYETLKSRGADFLTEPVNWGPEIRAFFRDPDGHLFEISELTQK